jgi:hypothetical protein
MPSSSFSERYTTSKDGRIEQILISQLKQLKRIVFTRSRPRNGRPAFKITLLGQTVEEVIALKILGLTFDGRLTWQIHVRDAKIKAKKRLNILRWLTGTEWGADRVVFLRTHSAVILAILRYGETAYGSGRDKMLQQLESVHNQRLGGLVHFA